jgi:hypothetical protein
VRGLYAVTPDEADTTRLVALVRDAVAGGVGAVQYRNKSADASLRRTQVEALLAVTRPARVALIELAPTTSSGRVNLRFALSGNHERKLHPWLEASARDLLFLSRLTPAWESFPMPGGKNLPAPLPPKLDVALTKWWLDTSDWRIRSAVLLGWACRYARVLTRVDAFRDEIGRAHV